MDNNTLQNNTKNTGERIFTDIEAELRTRFELLPSELQNAITSSEYQTKLFEIAKIHKLTFEKLGQLEMETTMVLLGMTPPDEYRTDLVEQIGLPEKDVDSIVHEINEQVFKPIRESLMKLYNKDEVETGEKINEKSISGQPVVARETEHKEPAQAGPTQEPQTQTNKTQVIQQTPAENIPKPIAPTATTPADKVAELKKMVSQAANPSQSAPKSSEPLSTARMSISEIIKKAGDMKPQLSEGTPKSTPVELNSEKEVMVSKMEAGKPYGMHTMPNTVGNIAQKEPIKEAEKTEDGIFGQIKSIFAEPKKPMDVIVKKDGDLKQGEIQQGTQNNPSGDRYREPI